MAKRVLVTLPIGVLKSMPDLITPPISKAKADAIQNLGMGTYMKIYLKFESAWWSKESKEDEASSSSSFNFNPFIGIIDEVSDGIGCIFDYNACKGVPVLLAIAPKTFELTGTSLHPNISRSCFRISSSKILIQ